MSFIKKLFFQDTLTQQQLQCKRRRWLFGKLKKTPKSSPSLEAPVQHKLEVAEETKMVDHEARKSIINKCGSDASICTYIEADHKVRKSITNSLESRVDHQAATKIQTSYRGHLARKALRALKGFVILQAIIRGQAVRRQAATTLRCLLSIVSIQSEICARRRQLSQQLSIERRSDCGIPTTDDENDSILRKKQAILRRQRNKTCSFNHRASTDTEEDDSEGRLKYWLNQYVDKNGENQSISGHRRSFQNSYIEDVVHPSSPTNLPTYMAATKSAKAKTRSLSSPRLRLTRFESYSDGDSPYKHKLSPISSINSEVTSSTFSKVSNKACYSSSQPKSPRLKGVYGPVRSNRIDE